MEGIGRIGSELPDLREAAKEPSPGGGFAGALERALASTDALQREADGQVEKLALGGGNLHETALALEKADVSMRVLLKVRNRLVEAYQDVMRMNV